MWVTWAGLGFRTREEQVPEVSDQEGGSWHGTETARVCLLLSVENIPQPHRLVKQNKNVQVLSRDRGIERWTQSWEGHPGSCACCFWGWRQGGRGRDLRSWWLLSRGRRDSCRPYEDKNPVFPSGVSRTYRLVLLHLRHVRTCSPKPRCGGHSCP